MSRPQIVESPALMRERLRDLRRDGATIGFVPTMGALHEGHLSLVEAAAKGTDVVVVSVFVNPTQFAPGEDFERYPRRLDADVDLLAGHGVDLVFAPGVESMYSPGAQTTVHPGALAARWEGEVRPDHFEGVATVVTKLLSIVGPDVAFFGEKDYQQLRVVQQLAADLDLGVRIVGCPIVREADGLALSSRNAYLSPQERAAALGLSRALAAARALSDDGVTSVSSIEHAMVAAIAEAGTDTDIDYAAIVDADTLEPLSALRGPARAIIAARVGATRLIDNCELTPAARP